MGCYKTFPELLKLFRNKFLIYAEIFPPGNIYIFLGCRKFEISVSLLWFWTWLGKLKSCNLLMLHNLCQKYFKSLISFCLECQASMKSLKMTAKECDQVVLIRSGGWKVTKVWYFWLKTACPSISFGDFASNTPLRLKFLVILTYCRHGWAWLPFDVNTTSSGNPLNDSFLISKWFAI